MNNEQVEFNKNLGKNRKESNIKSCIWGGDHKVGCSSRIIDAHSIQRGKILANIADSGIVYYLGLVPEDDMSRLKPVFRTEGIKKFSTFNGFCGEHDKSIFQPIEDKCFIGSDEQKNIYAYRANAKELHANMESSKFVKNLLGDKLNEEDFPPHFKLTLPDVIAGKIIVPPYIKDAMLEGYKNDLLRTRLKCLELNISELKIRCDHLKNVLNGEVSSKLEHLYFSLDKEYPIACSSNFIPYFGYEGNQIIQPEEVRKVSEAVEIDIESIRSVTLSIFPEGGKTHLLFTFSSNNESFKNNIKTLFRSGADNVKKGVSNIIINYIENTAFNPSYIESKFDEGERESIAEAYSRNIIEPDLYSVVDINLFRD